MGTANNRSILACEQSLRRSFNAIHRPESPSSDMPDLKKADEGKAFRRRTSTHQSSSLALPGPPRRRRITIPASSKDMPSLPFHQDGRRQDERKSTRKCPPARTFQRRLSAPITADVAQEMVMKLATEKRRERRNLTNNAISNTNKPVQRASTPREHTSGFRMDYIIGDPVRSLSHMITDPTSQAIGTLQKHDFAFIKRSDGSYSYAILAFRSFEPIKKGTGTEECMTFVTNETGSTKIIRERHWREFVRPASMVEPRSQAKRATEFMPSPKEQLEENPAFCQDVSEESEDIVPDMILFDQEKVSDEECSLISSVSDKARTLWRYNHL